MCPMHSEARQTEMSEFGARERFIAGPCKEPAGSCSKKSELPEGFRQRIFESQVREGGRRVCDQFLDNSLIG